MRSLFPNGRCIWHGGKASGPRSKKGVDRISAAQKRRWKKWRQKNPRILLELSQRQEQRIRKRFEAGLAKEAALQALEAKVAAALYRAGDTDLPARHLLRMNHAAQRRCENERGAELMKLHGRPQSYR
jgi:hypothetical protein